MKARLLTVFAVLFFKTLFAQTDSAFYTIRLSSFEATVINNAPKLHWKTVCFLEYATFQIQLSKNGKDFVTLHTFSADKLRCQQPFEFIDTVSQSQGKVYYRINAGNIDGKFYNSAIRVVSLDKKSFGLLSVYPTIVSDVLHFSVVSDHVQAFTASIVSQGGIIMKSKMLSISAGSSNFDFKVDNFSPGLYLLLILNDKKEKMISRFIKQ